MVFGKIGKIVLLIDKDGWGQVQDTGVLILDVPRLQLSWPGPEQVPLLTQKSQKSDISKNWGGGHQLVFSTDPNLSKSKTKCILFCGRVNSVEYPVPVLLDGKELSWVQPGPGPGGYHGPGGKIRSAEFINRTVEIREQLSFAYSSQVLKDQVYSLLCLWFYAVSIELWVFRKFLQI